MPRALSGWRKTQKAQIKCALLVFFIFLFFSHCFVKWGESEIKIVFCVDGGDHQVNKAPRGLLKGWEESAPRAFCLSLQVRFVGFPWSIVYCWLHLKQTDCKTQTEGSRMSGLSPIQLPGMYIGTDLPKGKWIFCLVHHLSKRGKKTGSQYLPFCTIHFAVHLITVTPECCRDEERIKCSAASHPLVQWTGRVCWQWLLLSCVASDGKTALHDCNRWQTDPHHPDLSVSPD